jgi:hypothetical protein
VHLGQLTVQASHTLWVPHTDGEGEELGEVVAVAVVVLVVAASFSGGAMYPGRWAAHAEWHVSMASPTTA